MNKTMLINVGGKVAKEASDFIACAGAGLKCGVCMGGMLGGMAFGMILVGKIGTGITNLFTADSEEEEEDEDI